MSFQVHLIAQSASTALDPLSGVGGVAMAVVSIVIAAGALIIAYLNNATRLMKRVDELTTKVFESQDQILALRIESSECRRRETEIKAELMLAGSRIKQLEANMGLSSPPPLAGIVVADLKGIVREFSPAVTPILNYLPREVIGKPISMLIPPELSKAHTDAFGKAILAPEALDGTKEVLTYGLAKGGVQVPIAITLHGWKAGTEGLITATIRQRIITQQTPGTSPVPLGDQSSPTPSPIIVPRP